MILLNAAVSDILPLVVTLFPYSSPPYYFAVDLSLLLVFVFRFRLEDPMWWKPQTRAIRRKVRVLENENKLG